MAKYSRIEVFLKMKENGMVPLYYSPDVEKCKKVVKACYDGGARSFEFTNRGDYAHEVFGELNKYAKAELPGMAMGVGSVIDAGTTSLYIQLGADFIVSPLMNPDMAKVCNRRKVLWSPGCGSVSEISQAEELGCELIKIFPGSQVGGPAFVASVKGPCPWTDIMPSGGVTPERDNLEGWFKAGATCVGMGSQMMKKEYIEGGDFEGLAKKVKETIALIKEIRS
ncbi:MAG: bifunctional 4-hydroxy-2-oxoglutarate aldolase/2-dehydro-3-deoxy-phosphogluconate aldolase [Prolixibacteraceae bacterium]|jgi:2-dehydro-3-deoxyphosphogluconate aldolase/(4S)-4-hydroxy-2-oxoglutarate aldolase|nr:bifunctional 4-hydroxy-2-oxoglutarate aldolase/2-dehydro-3-deoxy-phosphogluconate aldolase [Prolixibacteraceae bacterium]